LSQQLQLAGAHSSSDVAHWGSSKRKEKVSTLPQEIKLRSKQTESAKEGNKHVKVSHGPQDAENAHDLKNHKPSQQQTAKTLLA